VLLTWEATQPILDRYANAKDDGSVMLKDDYPPKELLRLLKELPGYARPLDGLRPDQVLDREMLEEARRRGVPKPLDLESMRVSAADN